VEGELARVAAAQGDFVFRWQALAAGCTEQEIAGRLRRGEWMRVRRGAYASTTTVQSLSPAQRHVLVLRAAAANLDGDVVATGYSALAVYDVPLWGVDLSVVHVHREAAKSSRREAGVSHHRGPLELDDVREVDGVLVAAPERALLDAARGVSFEAGVVLADGARRLPGFSLERATAQLEVQRDWPFSVAASKVLHFSDPRAATVGESRARVLLARIGMPQPDLQRVIRDSTSGQLLGITDFYLDRACTAVEFDGKVKYGRALYEKSGRVEDVDLGEVVWAEKKREDALRDDGHEVVRIVWSDLDGGDDVVRGRLQRAFNRASARRASA
jgi:hypothetical protein